MIVRGSRRYIHGARKSRHTSLLITLEPPTKPMNDEATSAKRFYTPEAFLDRHFGQTSGATAIADILKGNVPSR